ncbi:MAG: hypothetical protein MUF81_01010 [Verrucomicrobia bacterium]|jgi:hypothetical protein|nr:hypothetical protein [Verrucomicrobiota bacterium]
MKLRFQIRRRGATLLLAALLGRAAVHAGPPQPAAPAKAPAPAAVSLTNGVMEVPPSVFVVASATQAVRDPFFPNSTRLAAAMMTTSTNVTGAAVSDLALKGLSGTAARPLATINNRILEPGEEQEIVTSAGKVRVRCVAINLKDESVVIEAGGTRRELRFPRRK